MKRGFLALLLFVVAPAFAQVAPTAQPAPVPAQATGAEPGAPQPRPLAPFVASYAVLRDGKAMGDATLKLERLEGERWRVDLGIRGTRGLVGLVGLNL